VFTQAPYASIGWVQDADAWASLESCFLIRSKLKKIRTTRKRIDSLEFNADS
jgi:hypothetical protein